MLMLPEIPELLSPFSIPSLRPLYFGTCAVCCSTSNLKQCSSCFSVAYCCEEHQLIDWKVHQESCKPYVKLSDDGRLYQADRKTPTATPVFNFKPIMMCPNSVRSPAGRFQCIVCCGFYHSRDGVLKCPACHWPVCSLECSKKPIHTFNECEVFKKAHIMPDKAPVNLILTIRCLMLHKSNPEAFAKILEACEEFHFERSPKAYHEDQVLVRFLLHRCGLDKVTHDLNLNVEFLHKFVEIIEVSTLTMIDDAPHEFKSEGYGSGIRRGVSAKMVFLQKLKIQRHCSPNMRWLITFHPELTKACITFRTTTDVDENENLSAAWGDEIHCGTLVRQRLLTSRFTEPCMCSRCLDPTENQTEFNSLRCVACKQVSIRPLNPVQKDSCWKCFTDKCKRNSSQHFQRDRYILSKIHKLNMKFEDIQRLEPDEAIAKLLTYFNTDRSSPLEAMFHERHFILVRLSLFFIRAVTKKLDETTLSGDIDFEILTTAGRLVSECLEIYPKLIPGTSEILGQLLYQKQAFLSARCLRNVEWFMNMDTTGGGNSQVKVTEKMHEVRDLQANALEALKWCGEGTVPNSQARKLKKMLAQLTSIYNSRALLDDTWDPNILVHLFNMYAVVTSIKPMVLPNQPIPYNDF